MQCANSRHRTIDVNSVLILLDGLDYGQNIEECRKWGKNRMFFLFFALTLSCSHLCLFILTSNLKQLYCRRLVDMLSENVEVISFYPGEIKKGGKVTLGRIVVHDRVKVESDVLPRYFNHSSFASLRRQLNYFSFTRLGKGRQRGATYCNEGVVQLDDILRLKRRSTTVGAAREAAAALQQRSQSTLQRHHHHHQRSITATSGGHARCVSDSSISTSTVTREEGSSSSSPFNTSSESTPRHPSKKRLSNTFVTPTLISPRSSPIHEGGIAADETPPQITLDLTIPVGSQPIGADGSPSSCCSSLGDYYNINKKTTYADVRPQGSNGGGDEDVLAGCKALLWIRSLAPEDIASAF